jgi:hypothetical protein
MGMIIPRIFYFTFFHFQ